MKLNAAIQYFEKIQPRLKNNHELSFYIRFSFQLVAQPNQEPLEFQQSISTFVLYFAKTNSCFASIFFPFQEADEKFWNYIDSIKPSLPFVLEEKYLSLARIKNGRPSSFKKIVRPSV